MQEEAQEDPQLTRSAMVGSVGAEVVGRRDDGHGGARPSAGRTSSVRSPWDASVQFLAPVEQVEYGGADGVHGRA
jgi:hypothetical protein